MVLAQDLSSPDTKQVICTPFRGTKNMIGNSLPRTKENQLLKKGVIRVCYSHACVEYVFLTTRETLKVS